MKESIKIVSLVFVCVLLLFVLIKVGDWMFTMPVNDHVGDIIRYCVQTDSPSEPYGVCVSKTLEALKTFKGK